LENARSWLDAAFGHAGRRRLYYAAAAVGFLSTAAVLLWTLRDVHIPSAAEVTSQRVVVLKTADGHDLLHQGSFRLAPVAAKDMPRDLVNAVISIEDRRFYRHGGIDLQAMLRAVKQNFQGGRIVAGGSTITQQLVKILFLRPERTYNRKIQEAIIAIALESRLTKEEILTSYLNNVYLGSGAVGFPAAAKLYFGKNVSDLDLAEAAMLAGMIDAPSQNDPLYNLSAARRRAATVIDAMVVNGKLGQDKALVAKLHPATPSPTQVSPPSAGWFADWIYGRAAEAAPAYGGTVTIRTTLDPHLQDLAQGIIKSTLAEYGRQKRAAQAALVAMRPDGAVVAMVGGRSYAESQFNRAVQAKRQPGSAFKLFDYYAALRQGFSPEDEILDAPVDVKGWEPDNYGVRYHGRVTLAQAFANSYNAAAVRLSQEVGIAEVIAAARDLGLHAPLGNNPSLALGTSELSLLDLTAAYAAVRAGAAPVEPWGIAAVSTARDSQEVPVGRPNLSPHSLEKYQDQLVDLLRGVVEYGTGRAAALDGFAAGKTGTSQDYRDAWFIGFTDSLIVGVWVGNDDHSPMNKVVGGSLPAMIWKQFMTQAGDSAATQAQTQSPAPQAADETFDQSPVPSAAIAGEPGRQCNVPVCERYYHSFRASDCTYQPYWGERQYCDR
jgi:penicillin-binding protein 1A